MKIIWLSKGQFTLVDDVDFDYLTQWKWHVMQSSRVSDILYAVRTERILKGGKLVKRINVFMHRVILGLVRSKMHGDHKDGNGLNNMRNNLRACTHSQNKCNVGLMANNTSGYKGVTWSERDQIWIAQIAVRGKNKHIGNYKDKTEAILAYNKEANLLHGEFAYINNIK